MSASPLMQYGRLQTFDERNKTLFLLTVSFLFIPPKQNWRQTSARHEPTADSYSFLSGMGIGSVGGEWWAHRIQQLCLGSGVVKL